MLTSLLAAAARGTARLREDALGAARNAGRNMMNECGEGEIIGEKFKFQLSK